MSISGTTSPKGLDADEGGKMKGGVSSFLQSEAVGHRKSDVSESAVYQSGVVA